MGGLDQDVNPRMAARYPRLYYPGRQRMWFSRKVFAESAIHGLITSLVLICIAMGKGMVIRTNIVLRDIKDKHLLKKC